MLKNLCVCTPEESQRQINYLLLTPVSVVAELLRDGSLVLKKGVVTSLQFLGSLKTEFGQIGPFVPLQRTGELKFLVSEIVPILRANRNIPDDGLLQNIEAVMDKEARNEIEFNITVFLWKDEIIIKDGNKRTIAYFENRKNLKQNDICYEVYVVEPVQKIA